MRNCYECHWRDRVKSNASMSTCQTRHVGAVLVRKNRVVAEGFNGNLPGHIHCDLGGCPRCNDTGVKSGAGLERCVCVHAEQNIVSYCASEGIPMRGTTLYLPCTPCLDCFKLVVASGVREIVYAEPYPAAEVIVRQLAWVSEVTLRDYNCTCVSLSETAPLRLPAVPEHREAPLEAPDPLAL